MMSSASLGVEGRSPHGERGLKLDDVAAHPAPKRSLPTRGAWIEIPMVVWVRRLLSSLPTRGAWIEIPPVHQGPLRPIVAPHTGSVD